MSRKAKVGGGVALGVLALLAGAVFLNAWLVMLALGIVRGIFNLSEKVALGYWASLGLSFALGILKSLVFPTRITTTS